MTDTRTDPVDELLTGAEYAALAVGINAPSLLAVDGGLGLLHVSVDLERGREDLVAEGLGPEAARGEALARALAIAAAPHRSILVHVSPSGSEVWSAFMAIDGAAGLVVHGVPSARGLVYRVEAATASAVLARLSEILGISDGAPGAPAPPGPERLVGIGSYVEARDLVLGGDPAAGARALQQVGWQADEAHSLCQLLASSPTAYELHGIIRHAPGRLAVDELTWIVDPTWRQAWSVQSVDARQLSFRRATVADVRADLEAALAEGDA